MNNNIRLFTIVGVIISLVGYFYLMTKSFSLDQEIAVKKNAIQELEKMSKQKKSEIRELDLYINKQDSIIRVSKDTNTRKLGIELKIEMGEPIREYFIVTKPSNRNLENARKHEEEGFQYLLEKDVNLAINSFRKSENSYNGYHQVYEICRYLIKNEEKLSDKNSEHWRSTFVFILKQFQYKMPIKYKIQLEELTK